jgi:Ca-activated chloride channel family protein
VIADSDQTPNNRDFILRYRLAGQQIGSGLLLYQGKDENFFLLTAQPPRAVAADEVPPREYLFVLDVSGSMNGFPLNTAKQLMRDLVKVIRPSDTFNVVVFASGSQTFARSSIPATTLNLENALDFIGPKTGAGGTELLAAIKRALAIPRQPGFSRTVVLITDGYIEAEKDVFDYVADHLDEANIFAFGIGTSVNRYLIEGVARAGQGEPFVVTGSDETSTGWPVVPVGCGVSSAWVLRSWDRFRIPRPFARVAVVYGDPITVPVQLDDAVTETWRARIEGALRDATEEARGVAREAS